MYAAAYVWAKVLTRLEQQLTEVVVSAWLDDAEIVDLTKEKLILYSPSAFRQEIIQNQYAAYIEASVKELFDLDIKLQVLGDQEMKPFRDEKNCSDTAALNPQYSFETFVEGESNSFAKRVTMMAASDPGNETCNPLFIYGPPGVGKTHLLYAAANYLLQTKPNIKVVCIKAEMFTIELVRSIQNGAMSAFRNKYRQADVLLLDDIQFIAGKESTQEELFHTFNALYECNRQIILTADRRPSDMATLTDRLKDRFGEGVMVEIAAPDRKTRLEIVRNKAEKFDLHLSESIMEYLADAAPNIRQIEGSLKKIRAYRDLTGMPLSLESVAGLLDIPESSRSTNVITADKIIQQVCKYYSVEAITLKSPTKSRNIAEPRQIAMYLMRQMTKMSYDDIAKQFSRDRATVIHSIRKVDQAITSKDSRLCPILHDIQTNLETCT